MVAIAPHEELARWCKVLLAIECGVKPHLNVGRLRELTDFLERRGDKASLERLRGWFADIA